MDWNIIEGKWKELKGKAREEWGKLTDDDLEIMAGSKDKLAGRIQERYGIAKEDAERQVDDWATTVQLPETERARRKEAGSGSDR